MVVENIAQERLSLLEGTYEQVDRRLDDMNSRLDGMQRAIDGLRAELNNRYNTLVMLIVASWVTIMATLITALVALFLK